MAEKFTEQQRAAIETRDVSVGLSAGAGCGKTFVLTRRFLSYLEPPTEAEERGTVHDLSSLVAITFTERAAREMRSRIREECAARLRTCPDGEVPHWMRLVRELDSARIDTIHSFCGTLLRSNAVEAAIDPSFVQLDEMESSALRQESVARAVRDRLGERDPDMSELVFELGLVKTEDILRLLILQRFRIDFSAWNETTPEVLAERWTGLWEQSAIPRLYREFADSREVHSVMSLLTNEPVHSPKARAHLNVLHDLMRQLPNTPADPADLLERVKKAATVQAIRVSMSKGADQQIELYQQLQKAFDELRDRIKPLLDRLKIDTTFLHRSAEIGLRGLRAARFAIDEYERQKAAAAGLDFDDLLLRTRNLLRDHPAVRRRVAAGISLLMVDEFQDTDPVQTEIVRMMCGDQLLTGRLFLVGDHKQSIYRFRRAEPRVFHELRQEMHERGRLPLSQNFRSQPAILNFVNILFDDVLKPDYEPLVPSFEQLTPEPAIEFLFSTEANDEPGDENVQDSSQPPTPAKRNAEEQRSGDARWIARRLHALLHDGVPRIRDKNRDTRQIELRPVRNSDCVLLFRALTDVRYYEEALRGVGLDYYVVGGRAFYAQQEVYDIVNLLQSLDDPANEIALMGVLRSPFFAVSDDGLYALVREFKTVARAMAPRNPTPACLSPAERQQIEHARSVLKELHEQKDKLSLVHLLELAIARTGYDASLLSEFLGPRKLANLRKLLEMARQFDRAGLFTLSDFVEQLNSAVAEEAKESLAATHPETSDVIRLMSIHQSKGLEFPLVVVVDMDRRTKDTAPSATFDPHLGPLVKLPEKFGVKRENLGLEIFKIQEQAEALQEMYRLLYVATTRAASLLLLSAGIKSPDKLDSPWMRLVQQKFDLQTGQPRPGVLARHSRDCPQILVHHDAPALGPASSGENLAHVPLSSLRVGIEDAEPAELPESSRQIHVDTSAQLRFSVSQIEAADQLREFTPSSGKLFELHGSTVKNFELSSKVSSSVAALDVQKLTGREPEFLGTLVHGVLERVDFAEPTDVDNLVDGVMLSLGLEISAAVRDLACQSVRDVLASPLAKELAGAKRCHRELEFLFHWPVVKAAGAQARLIAGTIDCVFESPAGEWVLFDYKTKTLKSDDEADEVLAAYEIQLGIYCLAMRQMLNRLPDRVELVLIRDGVQRVSFQPTKAFVDGIARRVGLALALLTKRSAELQALPA